MHAVKLLTTAQSVVVMRDKQEIRLEDVTIYRLLSHHNGIFLFIHASHRLVDRMQIVKQLAIRLYAHAFKITSDLLQIAVLNAWLIRIVQLRKLV